MSSEHYIVTVSNCDNLVNCVLFGNVEVYRLEPWLCLCITIALLIGIGIGYCCFKPNITYNHNTRRINSY